MQQHLPRQQSLDIPLSRLVAGKRNPRKVKAAREAHHRLVALIRAQGLLEPLVVRPSPDQPKHYLVVAGHRRFFALKDIHRGDVDPKIPCVVRDVDAATADALALGENFAQAPMHPLDEAEAFAGLAAQEGKGTEAISAEFGVSEHYVRQRVKLATLARPVKQAYREGGIDTATAEAFAAVPEDRQEQVWTELNGQPRHAEQVRRIIAAAWIESGHALFDLAVLPESAVSRDLFNDRVLVERSAFMEAQAQALEVRRAAMSEEGWSAVVVARWEDVQNALMAMDVPDREFDPPTARKLERIAERRKKLEAQAEKIGEGDDVKMRRLQARYEQLESAEQEMIKTAPEFFSEQTKSIGTAFLLLQPDGRVRTEYRVLRRRVRPHSSANGNGDGIKNGAGQGGDGFEPERPRALTSEELSDRQLTDSFTHQALAVREALLADASARKRVLALILHQKVRCEALSIRHEANGVTLHAGRTETFQSPVWDRLREKRAKLDPFEGQHFVEDHEGYAKLAELSDAKLNALIDLLVVDCLTTHMRRRTELVHHLSRELKVDVRRVWRPDAAWLAGFQKIQLAHLIVEVKGAVSAPPSERKKSELVEMLAKLFTDAAEGKLEDKKLAERVNRWLPSNLRETAETETGT